MTRTDVMKFLFGRVMFVAIFVAILSVIIGLARGYRFDLADKKISSTGIIVANSWPDGAKILLNNSLKGATNSNVVVSPGTYDVEITKDGFQSWKKTITVKGELVLKADALLFPKNPSLSPVTSLGINKALVSPTHDKIIILSEKGDPLKDGLYVLANGSNPIAIINPMKLLILKQNIIEPSLQNAFFSFSPDEKQLLIELPAENSTEGAIAKAYLLNVDETAVKAFDVTVSVQALKDAWKVEETLNSHKVTETFKKPLPTLSDELFDIMGLSPDEEKILYIAKKSQTLPIIIKPRVIATNQTPEVRDLKEGSVYVYDIKEDKNFLIATPGKSTPINRELIIWYPTSDHLAFNELSGIAVADYDGTNKRTVYSGPFEGSFFTLNRDGKLIVLTNFNQQQANLPDLYTVGIR